jgi:antitoxin CptB
MTGTTMTSAGLDARRKRLLFRSWHRGIREMDLVLGTFADRELANLTAAELDAYEMLLGVDDQEMIKWVTGEAPVATRFDTPLFARIRRYTAEKN